MASLPDPVPGSARDPRLDYTDYRPDVYGLVEGPPDAPLDLVQRALRIACPDCNVNVFIEHADYEGGPPEGWPWPGWRLLIAHDDCCPWLTRLEVEHGP